MDEQQIRAIVLSGEGLSVEFKEAFPKNASDVAKEIVAFTNTQGGTLLFGVDDGGQIKGVSSQPDEIIRRLAGIARDTCKPPINPEMGHIHVSDKCVVWIKVRKESLPRSAEDKYYIRVGSTVRIATSDELVGMFTDDSFEIEIRRRIDAIFKNFRPENLQHRPSEPNDVFSNVEGEQRRISTYQTNRGLFLIHAWQPSQEEGQVADVAIRLFQHGDGPLNYSEIESVEYYLGPKFSTRPYIKKNADESFVLYISAYGPMLCLAKVNFRNSQPPLYLERYCDF